MISPQICRRKASRCRSSFLPKRQKTPRATSSPRRRRGIPVLSLDRMARRDGQQLRLPRISSAKGSVVIRPTAASAHPTARRDFGSSLSASSKATPAPRMARVPATKAISGKVNITVFTPQYTRTASNARYPTEFASSSATKLANFKLATAGKNARKNQVKIGHGVWLDFDRLSVSWSLDQNRRQRNRSLRRQRNRSPKVTRRVATAPPRL